MFAKRLVLALLISFFLEITLFNYTHYATLFTNKAFGVIYSEQEQDFISNLPDLEFNKVAVIDSFFIPSPNSSLKFKNLNTEMASIYINPVFLPNENVQHVMISWADEESSERSIFVNIIKGLDFRALFAYMRLLLV